MELDNFRIPSNINSRLAAWNPMEKSLRWHKSFLLLAANNLTPNQIAIYRSFGDVSVGNPVEAVFAEEGKDFQEVRVNIDYLLSLFEINFLTSCLSAKVFPKSIYEVGAGFGRTCHAILVNYPQIKKYRIIDFPQMLSLARLYLSRVLSVDNFHKIEFVEVEKLPHDHDEWELGIQIDGLQEMESSTIDFYFEEVFAKSNYFFSCNPIAKYRPRHAGLEDVPIEQLNTVLALGRSKKIVDIWNESELSEVRAKHIENYCPPCFSTVYSHPHKLFPHFEMTLYSKNC